MGMDVTLLCPNENYLLDARYMAWAESNAGESGGSLQVSHDIASAYAGADVVYAKSWGALPFFGQWDGEKPMRDRYKHFIVDEAKMALTNNSVFALSAAAPQHQSHRCGHGLEGLHRSAGSRKPPACPESHHGHPHQPP
jgi:ornithine carbamoyltransferase